VGVGCGGTITLCGTTTGVEAGVDVGAGVPPPPPDAAGGAATGVTAVLALEFLDEESAKFTATTNVYETPFVSPLTEQAVDAVVQLKPSGVDVTT
jgi:hypothetical protein